jgi:hypothetical protein
VRREEAERLRDYFELQLLFAEILADRTSCPLPGICLTFTNLHRRLGLGSAAEGMPSDSWLRYAATLERCTSTASRLEWTLAFFADVAPVERASRKFGCFSYQLLNDDAVVRIHFNNRDSTDGCSPLVPAKIARRMSELREMFRVVRAHHPKAQSVKGGSWLYNLEAYRRLFPPVYAASTFVPDSVRLNGTSSWGQVLDFQERVKPSVRQAILENIRTVDVAAPWTAFPLRALGAQSAIGHFHEFYS